MKPMRAALEISLDGPGIKAGRIGLRELSELARNLQRSVDCVAEVLVGSPSSAHPGRKPADVESACRLALIGIGTGSVKLLCDLERDEGDLFADLGESALKHLVSGINEIKKGHSMPKGFDRGTLQALHQGGAIFSHGVTSLNFDCKIRDHHSAATYSPVVHEKVSKWITTPLEKSSKTVEGRLLMGDFKDGNLHCRIHPPMGKPITCRFSPSMKDAIRAALTRYVRVSGEGTQSDEGSVGLFTIKDLQVFEDEGSYTAVAVDSRSRFEDSPSIDELAAEQGVSPVADATELKASFWPSGESVEEFVSTIRDWRREGETT